MDDLVTGILQPGALYLAFAVVIGTFFVRRIVETAVPSLRKQSDANEPGLTYLTGMARWWNEVILYAVSPVIGAAIGLANIPLVHGEITTRGGRILFGLVIGWFSSFFYKIFKRLIAKRVGVELPGGSNPPPPPDVTLPPN